MIRIEGMTAEDWPAVRATCEDGLVSGVASFRNNSAISKRACYAGVAEAGVYVAGAARGRGGGRSLLQTRIESAERNGI